MNGFNNSVDISRILPFLVMACWVVGAVACPEAGAVERDHAVGRMILCGCAAWVVLWGGWMLWRRHRQKPMGWRWLAALIVPLVNALPVGLLYLSEVATDINDSPLIDAGLVGCIFAALVDIVTLAGAIIYLLAPRPFPSNRQ